MWGFEWSDGCGSTQGLELSRLAAMSLRWASSFGLKLTLTVLSNFVKKVTCRLAQSTCSQRRVKTECRRPPEKAESLMASATTWPLG